MPFFFKNTNVHTQVAQNAAVERYLRYIGTEVGAAASVASQPCERAASCIMSLPGERSEPKAMPIAFAYESQQPSLLAAL